MQTIYLDISNKSIVPTIYAKQNDVGRKFAVILTDSGLPYIPSNGSVFSVWYKGASGEGNYTEIGDKSAFSLNGNKVEVEMIVQMLSAHGDGVLCLTLNSSNGNQISSWNIPYICEFVPGAESEKAEEYYTAFSKAVEELPYPDETLSISGKAADAAATGLALSKKAPAGYGLGTIAVEKDWSDVDNLTTNGWYRFGVVNDTINNVGIVSALVRVDYYGYNYGVQTLYAINTASGSSEIPILRRTRVYGGWQPWECVNPPMEFGKEYRTTKRHNGKAVYTKLITYSPSNFATQIFALPHGIANFDCGLDIKVSWLMNGSDWRHLPSVYFGDAARNGHSYWNGIDGIAFELGESLQMHMAASIRDILVTVEYTKSV